MSAFHDNMLLGASGAGGGYQIERSLRFDGSAYLNRIPASAGNRKTYTISMWVKRGKLGATARLFGSYSSSSVFFEAAFDSSDNLYWYYYTYPGYSYRRATSQVFRDSSAWVHLVFAFDSTNATAADRVKIYANGQQITTFFATVDPTQNFDCLWNSTSNNVLGDMLYDNAPGGSFDGYIAEIYNIDGQALTPSSFGETDTITGVWKPKKYAGTYGTNGSYLNFSDNSGATSTTLGKDGSGNGNNWTPNNFSVTAGSGNDSMIDTPTPYADGGNGRGNYCTWNPLKTGTNLAPEDGNLFARMQSNGSGLNQSATGTIYVSSGKWYWEGTSYNTLSGYGQSFGIASASFTSLNSLAGSTGQTYGYEKSALKYDGLTPSAYGASYTTNDIIGVALDLDAGTLVFYKNGASQGTAFTGLSGTFTPYCGLAYNGGGPGFYTNFGQRPFAYTPPAGFLALNTQNLPEPTIKKPSSYMDVVTYMGAGATQTISSLGFSPDLLWIKSRSGAGYGHRLMDSARGPRYMLMSNSTDVDYDLNSGGDTPTLDSNGFTLPYGINGLYYNGSGGSFVAWCWDESATPGFDIVTFNAQATAATVAHSLGVAPKFIIMKDRDTAAFPWIIYHSDVGIQKYLQFSTASSTTTSTAFSTAPTSTVFDPGTGVITGNGYNRLVAYLWSEVAGFSKFGSYTGNGSTDGPFVFCGFRPRWVMIKRTDSAADWVIIDAARNSYNAAGKWLLPNSAAAEYDYDAYYPIDILSNGFKLRTSVGSLNAGAFIYAAFAESPFKYSLAR